MLAKSPLEFFWKSD